jgi:hypothetical protein
LTHPADRSCWPEDELDIPVHHVVVDLDRVRVTL